MPKKGKPETAKQVRLNDENHAALVRIKSESAMNLSLTAMANFAVEIALPEIRKRFCKPTTTPTTQ